MIYSMTGYSNQTINIPLESGTLQANIILKSLNGRFFEATCKLPHVLSHLETDIGKKLKHRLYRGNVYCTVFCYNPHIFKSHMRPSQSMINSYLDAIANIQNQYDIPGSLDINRFITLPHIFETHEEPIPQDVIDQIMNTIDTLIDRLIEDRKQEGAALQKDLEERLSVISNAITKLEKRSKEVLKERREKLLENLPETSQSNDESREHQMHMIHSQLDKIDIHEEIVRFKNHLENMYACISSEQVEKGKRLDFILQELFREINTINAKCSDSQLSNLAITIKVELEKTREQVQNIV